MGPEATELVGPERLDLIEPRLQRQDRLGPQLVEPPPGVGVVGPGLDEPAPPQHAQVPAHGRRGHADVGGEVAGRSRAEPEQIDDPASGRVGQRGEGEIQVVFDVDNS
jgi:hypothetical protein